MPSREDIEVVMDAHILGGILLQLAVPLCRTNSPKEARHLIEITIEEVLTRGVDMGIEIPEEMGGAIPGEFSVEDLLRRMREDDSEEDDE